MISAPLWAGELTPRGVMAFKRELEIAKLWHPINLSLNPLEYSHLAKLVPQGETLVVRVLAIRVQFPEEIPDDPQTTGNGRFVLEPQPSDNPLEYDPPHDKAYFEAMLEMAARFFRQETFGRVKIEYVVKPDGADSAYELPHSMRYYGDWDYWGEGIVSLIKDAVEVADQDTSVSFVDIDRNGVPDYEEGVLPVLIVFHAGSAYQTDINFDSQYDVPALTAFAGAFSYYLGTPYLVANDGQDTIYAASLLPEQMSQDGWRVRLQATLVHEMTHLIWMIPDLYDYTYKGSGVGAWDIQGSAAYLEDPDLDIPAGLYPPLHSAWSRWKWMNWYFVNYVYGAGFLPREVWEIYDSQEGDTSFTLAAATWPDTGEIKRLRFLQVKGSDREYWLLEVRKRDLDGDGQVKPVWRDSVVIGPQGEEWDFLLPGDGLLIWHVDERIIDSTDYYDMQTVRPMGLDLEEADRVQDLEFYRTGSDAEFFGSPQDPFYAGNNDRFGPGTDPGSRFNRGGQSGVLVYEISAPGYTMSFRVSNELLLWRAQAGDSSMGGAGVAVGDLDGDGSADILVWREGSSDTAGANVIKRAFVYGFRADGSQFFSFSVSAAADTFAYYMDPKLLRGAPAVGNLDPAPGSEIVLTTTFGEIYAFSSDSQLWRVSLGYPILSSPALADLDGDGFSEVLVGAENREIVAFDGDGSVLWRTQVSGPLRGSVGHKGDTLFALLGDGTLVLLNKAGEVISRFGEGSPKPNPSWAAAWPGGFFVATNEGIGHGTAYVLSSTLDTLAARKISKPVQAGVAVGDIDGDGRADFAFVAGGELWVLSESGALASGFPVKLPELPYDSLEGFSHPIFADGKVLLAVSGKGVYAWELGGKPAEDYPLSIQGNAGDGIALWDLNGDGALELVAADSLGNVWVWRTPETKALWPQLGFDGSHSSYLPSLPSGSAPAREALSRVYVYPNPVYGDRAYLRLYLPEDAEVEAEIYTFYGERVKAQRQSLRGGGMAEMELDLEGLPPAVYMLKVRTLGKTKIIKFAKNKPKR